MKKILSVAIALMVLSSCTSIDKEFDGRFSLRDNHISRFYATIEQSGQETKVYADEDLKVLWNAGDFLSVFNQRTYNSKFEFKGEDGDNAGDFEDVTPSGLHSGNALDNVYAVYPYASGNKINNAGNTITLTLPAEQQYKAHSFGIGANTMVAVTNDSYLAFKNLCGYLQLRLYGDNVKVSSITIQGNNGEKIAGKASVAVGLGVLPTVTMDETATDAITLVCDPPVQLGSTAEDYTDFWFVIPPTTFSTGFTITVTDELGGVFQKTTTKSLTITRSTIEWMSALQVTPNYDNVNVVFEDANFKAYCVENFDKNGDGEISVAEAKLVTAITINPEIVASVKGIEQFKNLESFTCRLQWNKATTDSEGIHRFYYNEVEVFSKLTSIDVSNNTKLKCLDCCANSLQDLNMSNNSALTSVDCSFNLLPNLDVSNNTALTTLHCNNNQLTSLDVSQNTSLTYLGCGCNQLVTLDVSNNIALTGLDCIYNQLATLDVSNNMMLSEFHCRNNQLTTLDVSNNTMLHLLDCDYNQLTSLDLSNNAALILLGCNDNQLTTLDVDNNIALTELHCFNNQLTTLDVSNNIALKNISCYNNLLTTLDVSKNISLTELRCNHNKLTSLDVSNNTALIRLYCYKNKLTILDVSYNTALNDLRCYSNYNLTEIWLNAGQAIDSFSYDTDVATIKYHGIDDIVAFEDDIFKAYCLSRFDADGDGNISFAEAYAADSICIHAENLTSLQGVEYFVNIKRLECSGDRLTSIDISHNTALVRLFCYGTQLTSLDVSNHTALNYLGCWGNKLTSLDISNNVALKSLDCSDNQLKSLDISNNTALTGLFCNNNQLTSLEVSNNTALTRLECDDNQLTSLDISNNTALNNFSCVGNKLASLSISNNTALTSLDCSDTELTSLDVSNNTLLTVLRCRDTQLASLDVSTNTALRMLDCTLNPNLTEIWLKTGQTIKNFTYDTAVATIRYKD